MTSAKLEIMELFSKYLLCLDERRFNTESFAEIFTENAEVSIPSKINSKECRGLQEIRDVHLSLHRMIKSSHHMSSDYIFELIDENGAEVRCNLLGCYNSFKENGDSFSTGTVKFSAVHTKEGWRIQRMLRKAKTYYQTKIQDASLQ